MHYPYAPPASDVTPVPARLPRRPWPIFLICIGLAIDNILSLVGSMRDLAPELASDIPYFAATMVTALALSAAVLAWLSWSIWQGKNWARWTIPAIDLFGLAGLFFDATEFTYKPRSIDPLEMSSIGLEAAVLILLFLGKTSQWFADCATVRKNVAAFG